MNSQPPVLMRGHWRSWVSSRSQSGSSSDVLPDRHLRLCHLVAAMQLEEDMPARRSVPSAFTLLKAEYGFVGTRQQVFDHALAVAQRGVSHVLED